MGFVRISQHIIVRSVLTARQVRQGICTLFAGKCSSLMIAILDLMTLCWLGLCALQSVRALARSTGSPIDVVIIAHFFLCGLPLLCDLCVGVPDYSRFPGFALAAQDGPSRILYCLYVSICPILWLVTGRPKQRKSGSLGSMLRDRRLSEFSRRFRGLLLIAAAAPLLAVWFAPALELYTSYSMASRNILSQSDSVRNFHMYLSALCTIGVIAATGWILGARRAEWAVALVAPFLLAAFWIVGKRYIVALALALITYALWYRGVFRTRIVAYIAGTAVLASLIAFSVHYQSSVRSVNMANSAWQDVYESMRIDFGRDAVIRMAIYAEMHPDLIQMLEYRGQSFWIYLTLPVPRASWPDKPISYGTSVAAESMLVKRQYLGWAMTTSILDEAIANLSWFGMLGGPLLISFVCRVGESCNDSVTSSFTVIVALLLLCVHLSAFAPVALIWVMLAAWRHMMQGAANRTRSPAKGSHLGASSELRRRRQPVRI